MNRKWMTLLAVSALLMAAGSALADLVDNGTTTTDTDTGLEWLDITETTGLSYNEVLASDYVTNDGYRFATEAEVHQLYTNAGGTPTQGVAF